MDMALFAYKLDRPAPFPGHLTVPGYLPTPCSIDSLLNLRDFSLSINAVSGRAFVIKESQGIVPPW
jgi:hypothetical protein